MRNIFAILVAGVGLVSCSDTSQDYIEKCYEATDKVAAILMDCQEWDDAFDAADEIHDIAEDMEKLDQEYQIKRSAIRDAEMDMTEEEHKTYRENIHKMEKEAKKKLETAIEHVKSNDAGKSAYLQFALDRFNRAF